MRTGNRKAPPPLVGPKSAAYNARDFEAVTEGAITLVVEEAAWRRHGGLLPKLKAAAQAARKAAKLPARRRLTVLLAGNARLKSLNRDFRGRNKPTNVLSFPSAGRD